MTWYAFHLEEGRYGETDLAGRTVVAPAYSPGPLLEGGWTMGLYLDEGTTPDQEHALTRIFTGEAGGPIRMWSFLISRHLGVQKAPIHFKKDDRQRTITIPKTLECSIAALPGGEPGEVIRLLNLPYWINREVVVCRTEKGRFRGFGFNWETGGKSADPSQEAVLANGFNQIHASTQVLALGTTRFADRELALTTSGTHALYSRFSWAGP